MNLELSQQMKIDSISFQVTYLPTIVVLYFYFYYQDDHLDQDIIYNSDLIIPKFLVDVRITSASFVHSILAGRTKSATLRLPRPYIGILFIFKSICT